MATPKKTTTKATPKKTADAITEAAPAAVPAVTKSEVKASASKAKAKPAIVEVTYDTINARAYEIYAGRGYAAGNPDEDWHEAERQLRAGL